MYLLQIADLHINDDFSFEIFRNEFELVIRQMELNSIKEKIVVCILGDIIDKGQEKYFEKAQIVMEFIMGKGYTLEFVPGNHDIVDGKLEAFNKFIKKYVPYSFEKKSIIERTYDDLDLILINSVYHCDYKYGKINIRELDAIENKYRKSVCLMHHTILSENDGDQSALRNAYHFLEEINKKNVIAILHGHTHGYKDITVNGNCDIIGVGPFFKDIPNINHQCNIIQVNNGFIEKIVNCRYNADINSYSVLIGQSNKSDNYYFSESIYSAHQAVINKLKNVKRCINLHIKIETCFDLFQKEINQYYQSVEKDAKSWLLPVVPDNLYYNHGSYMNFGDTQGVDYVIKELKRKENSSRAVIPLINFKNVVESGDSFLPSFNILQFSFFTQKETVFYANLYLRDVEVNNFLYINIYELYLIIKKILGELGRDNDTRICLNIYAFWAQYKEKFGCFMKAQLDRMTEAQLTIIVQGKKCILLKELIKEKINLHETIIQNDGFVHLRNAFKAINDFESEDEIIEDIICKLEIIICKQEEIKKKRSITNNIDTIENELYIQIQQLLDLIERI